MPPWTSFDLTRALLSRDQLATRNASLRHLQAAREAVLENMAVYSTEPVRERAQQ